ncbi:PepSY domain-containing protein [Halobacillus kuroshimensis]|uniref:Peptidase M4 n=2 Tax=Halobacillus TaxID=45667 RepID=A0A845DRD2_9BACI|nr:MULTISPECIES: PepSY domain-containing protein [Halobacillus]MBN8236977.1 PepSY domain-containing protein [Halobacillus kuroshimensis]MCA1021940.1 PepSY domain-containing protein [Halobacillus litoralis]MYL20083.1 peptidase M4 [Halobacillus litoralis]MYL29215.1 peptidase M4 [Halobacillus halophilus]MYL38933.1 peptidase M4 [Halobacillus litoralis]
MNWKKVAIAAGVGALAGYIVKEQISSSQNVTPEKALKIAKEAFKKQGPISGSWIYMKPEELNKNGINYDVYRGGISKNQDGETSQFEFYIDTDTGTIVDVAETTA